MQYPNQRSHSSLINNQIAIGFFAFHSALNMRNSLHQNICKKVKVWQLTDLHPPPQVLLSRTGLTLTRVVTPVQNENLHHKCTFEQTSVSLMVYKINTTPFHRVKSPSNIIQPSCHLVFLLTHSTYRIHFNRKQERKDHRAKMGRTGSLLRMLMHHSCSNVYHTKHNWCFFMATSAGTPDHIYKPTAQVHTTYILSRW